MDAAESLPAIKEKSLPDYQALTEIPLKPRQRRVLNAFIVCGGIMQSCESAGLERQWHYKWLKKSENYRKAFAIAEKMFGDFAVGEVRSRGFVGEQVSVTRRHADGSIVTESYRKKSDVLAMFALKAIDPRYKDNFSVVNEAGPIAICVKVAGQEITVGTQTD